MFVFNLTKSFKCLPTSSSCISNIPNIGCIAHYNTKVNDIFFNRKQELLKFTKAFSGNPELHVVLGPPSTGKTALIREVTSKGNFKPLFIDCRNGQFDTPERIYNSIYSQFKPLFDDNKLYLRKIIGEKFEISYTNFNEEYKFNKTKKITSSDVMNLLNNISFSLPKWTFWKKPLILVIDEANMFSQLSDNLKEGEILLKSILNWFVRNTKQEKCFHVVLTTSDSFFLNWIVNQLSTLHITPYVVGDLSKEEAEEYFEEYVLPQYECKELKGKFNHIRRITGTRMLIIDKYIKEYEINEGKFKDNDFSVFQLENDKLSFGLDSITFLNKSCNPLWNKDDLIKVMKAIVKSEDQGFVLEQDLISEIGYKKVRSLVDYNFLYRRLTNNFANDINPPSEVVLTAMNQPSLRAMEYILQQQK